MSVSVWFLTTFIHINMTLRKLFTSIILEASEQMKEVAFIMHRL